ncbi:MAG: 2-aminoethylphosphonate--pyruvate transaminase, partial [Gammaproteobacteria bacterium]|nr:2-aminoethylphosphonate--pyruvate transaminase [Gammaproteobacteria bacterium]
MTEKPDPWLLTPGPLTTSISVKQAMLHDWGSRDKEFIRVNQEVREKLVNIANAGESHVCVPIQGSGTFAVEATLGTLIGPSDKALVLVNGAYGKRICKICEYHGLAFATLETAENIPSDTQTLDKMLGDDNAITHVAAVHCETTSGILNPIQDIAIVTARHQRKLIIDTMSAFGALPLDAKVTPFDALVASSNKCFEGVPGMGFAIIKQDTLERCKGNSTALSLDLYDQWVAMQGNGQWRFTPPTHVL